MALVRYPYVRLLFAVHRIPWGKRWRFYGIPIIQKHRGSNMAFGDGLGLRSSLRSNPLGPNHPVIFCTWKPGATLEIGENFAMTGGTICAAARITIGNNVTVGANSTIIDTDFHPLSQSERSIHPDHGTANPIFIEDNVFIGMNCLVLKGIRIGNGSVIGAGSVVTKDIPSEVVAAGNPARIIRHI